MSMVIRKIWLSAAALASTLYVAAAAQDHGSATLPGGGAIGGLRDHIPFRVGQRNVKDVLIDGRYTWIGSSGGLIKYDTHRGSYRVFDNKSGLLSNGVFHVSKQAGRIWVGTYGGGLSILDPDSGAWENYNIPDGMGDAFVYDALTMPNGDVWIATWSGANRIRGGALSDFEKWDLFTLDSTGGGLPNDWVYGLAAGENGVVWLATEGGLARFEDGDWQNWTHADGLGAPLEVVEADLTFGRDPGEVSSHHARQKQEQGLGEVKVAYNPNYIVALDVGPDGAVWAGTWGAGLSRFDGTEWTTWTVKDGLPGNHVFSVHVDAQGRIWVGTNAGLARLVDGRFQTFGVHDGIAVQSVFAIDTVGQTAWVGGYGGLTWFPRGLSEQHESEGGN